MISNRTYLVPDRRSTSGLNHAETRTQQQIQHKHPHPHPHPHTFIQTTTAQSKQHTAACPAVVLRATTAPIRGNNDNDNHSATVKNTRLRRRQQQHPSPYPQRSYPVRWLVGWMRSVRRFYYWTRSSTVLQCCSVCIVFLLHSPFVLLCPINHNRPFPRRL